MPQAIPSVSFTILSNGLGNVAPTPSGTIAVLGCSSGGTAETPSGPYVKPGDVITDFGYGSAPELAANLTASGIPVVFVKVDTDTAGAASAVTFSGTGTSVMTTSGDPFDQYDVIVTVVRAGTVGSDPEPGFTISLDGGLTTTREIRMPASGSYTGLVATTGITLNFTAATMVVGDTYTFTSTAPTWAAADAADALESLRTSEKSAGLGYVVGACSKAQADTLVAVTDLFVSRKKFMRFVFEARDIGSGETEAAWMTAISSDYATFVNDRVTISAGAALVQSVVSRVKFRRNIGFLAMVRAGRVRVSRDLGAVADGPLAPFASPGTTGTPVDTVYHDEGLNPGLNANRFMTVMKHEGITGYFITNPQVMTGPTSDFDLLQYGRVMDEACRITNVFFTNVLSTDVRLNRRTGFILEKDALALESGNDSALNAGLVDTGDLSPGGATTILSRSDNISATKTLTVTVELLPLAYIKTVPVTMTFTNPAFGSVAA